MNNFVGIRKILAATDFSSFGQAALRQAIWLARETGAHVTLLHVIRNLNEVTWLSPPSIQLGALGCDVETFQTQAATNARIRLTQEVALQNANDIEIDCRVQIGTPAITIAQEMQKTTSDIAIVGCRSQSTFGKWVLGSTAMRLVRSTSQPVWAVTTHTAIPPKKVLAATDFSAVSRKAANLARRVAKQSGAEFHLVHVVDSGDIPSDLMEHLSPGHTLRDQMEAHAQQNLLQFKQSLDSDGDEIHTHILWGSTSHEIAGVIQKLKIDLLTLGTTGRTGMHKLLLGTNAEKLLGSCDCSILTVKPDGFTSPLSAD